MSAWKRSKAAKGGGETGESTPATVALTTERPPADSKAAQLLALRPHFRRELEQKLARAGYERDEIAEALDKLERLRLLDDGALARSFVETVARRKGWGRLRIAQELARRGAPEASSAEALAGVSIEDDLEAAREAAARWRRRAGADRSDRATLARHLSRRGFTGNAILKVLKEMAPSDSDQEEDLAAEDGSGTERVPT